MGDKKAKDGKMRVRHGFIDSGEDIVGSDCNEDQAVSSPQPESKEWFWYPQDPLTPSVVNDYILRHFKPFPKTYYW